MKKITSIALACSMLTAFANADLIKVADGDWDGDNTLLSTNEYILTEIIYVRNGTLTIPAGTIIRGELRTDTVTFDPGALVITTSGRIDAQGTAAEPIIFTTAAMDNNQDGRPDGLDFFFNDNGSPNDTDDDSNNLAGDQVPTLVNGALPANNFFLDADPKGNPLPPAIYVGNGSTDGIEQYTDINGDTVDNEYRQLWGGIIILGEAPVNTNVAAAGGLNRQWIEGLPEVSGEADFGGFNPNDNSGILRYVSIRHGGAIIGSGNEINGLTMGGVGFGTTIEYIDVYCNADDGYEWFGGTVNTKYLTSIFNNDDAFDIDEGFTGLGQFWFCLMNQDTVNGDKGGEHDGETGDGNDGVISVSALSIPKTYPVIYNATYIGNPNKSTEAFRIRDEFGGEYKNSIFYGFGGTDGVEFEADGEARWIAGEVIFSGNTWFNVADNTAAGIVKTFSGGIAESTYETTAFVVGGSASVGNGIVDPGFRSLDRRELSTDSNSGVNPVPTAGGFASANNGNGNGFGEPETRTWFDNVTYKGAFSTSDLDTLWTTGWTALNIRGILVDRGDGSQL